MPASIDALIAGLIDYAGLFPPAKLGMGEACSEFARSLRGPHASALSHFIVPASRLVEFSEAAATLMPGTFATSGYREMVDVTAPWRVAALLDPENPGIGLEAVEAFNNQHRLEDNGLAHIDSIEVKAPTAAFIDEAIDAMPVGIMPFFEIDHRQDPRGMIAALSGMHAAAKIRTGGVTADAFPTPDELARFIQCCALGRVPFKCTAGLHHPIRGEFRLTYEDNPPRGTMFGFVNVFLAAAMVDAGLIDEPTTALLLRETNADAFRFDDEGATWRSPAGEVRISTDQIALSRKRFALSYGSCSFTEPTGELVELGWL
ncbi:MAG TPA: hypothetical protein ENJ00_08785 [Phycisphaerales bacterium]|nr:hypothetical protein [Phycisphaerales bacterium]